MTLSRVDAAAAILRLGRRMSATGLVVGSGGNISVRTAPDEIVVTPSGRALDELESVDLVALGLDGVIREGEVPPSSESQMHLAAHRARADAVVAIHVHPPYANLLAATGHPIRLVTLDHAYYVRRMATVPYLKSGSVELADAVAARLAEVDVVILAHHGCLVVAPGADAAFERVANLEAAATATYRALLLGDRTTVCPPEYLALVEAREDAAAAAGAGA
jgi:L-fuculose-phosphate aldolase